MKLNAVLIVLILLQSQQTNALGRLFMTADQRIQLEQKKSIKPNKDSQEVEEAEIKQPQSIFLNGFIKPKHSASTIWVNGQVRATKPQRNYFVRHWVSPTNQVSVDLQGRRAELSPGQTLDIDNNSVKAIYYATSLKSKESKEEEEDESEENEKQQNIKEKKKPSVIQKAIELNKIMTNLPTQ